MKKYNITQEDVYYEGEPKLDREWTQKYRRIYKECPMARESLPKDMAELSEGIPYRGWSAIFFYENANCVERIMSFGHSLDVWRWLYKRSYRIVKDQYGLTYILWVDNKGKLWISCDVNETQRLLKRRCYGVKPIPDPYSNEVMTLKLILFSRLGIR